MVAFADDKSEAYTTFTRNNYNNNENVLWFAIEHANSLAFSIISTPSSPAVAH